MVKDLLAFSDCGLYFAAFDPDGKLKVWDTSSSTLKQEYVPNLHLNSPCTSLVWINASSSVSSREKAKKRKVDDPDSKILALGTLEGTVALYSVAEGKVISTLKDVNSNPVSSLCWASDAGLFSSAGSEVTHWDLPKKSLRRKWRCGKRKISSLAVAEDGDMFVTGSYHLCLWKVEDNNITLLKKLTGQSSDVTNIVFVHNQYFLSCASEDRHVSVWNVKSENDEPLGRFALGEELLGNLSIYDDNGVVHICACTKDGSLHYFKHQLNGKMGRTIKPHASLEVASDGAQANMVPIVAAKVIGDLSAQIAYGYSPTLSFEPVTFSDSKTKRTCIVRSVQHNNKQVNNKVINSSDTLAEYVGNGVKRKMSGGELSMAQRLGNLSLGKPIVSDQHSPNNLSNLLTQGLESKDRSLLETVLFQTDVNVINETVSKLPITILPPLIAQLTHMIQGKTFSSIRGCLWLKGVLRQHSGQLVASGSTSSLLTSLQSLVESRLAVLGPLRELSGRLDHIVSQLDSAQDQSLTSDHPVLVFHDEESGDDEESMLLDGEEASESEDKWEELTDEETS